MIASDSFQPLNSDEVWNKKIEKQQKKFNTCLAVAFLLSFTVPIFLLANNSGCYASGNCSTQYFYQPGVIIGTLIILATIGFEFYCVKQRRNFLNLVIAQTGEDSKPTLKARLAITTDLIMALILACWQVPIVILSQGDAAWLPWLNLAIVGVFLVVIFILTGQAIILSQLYDRQPGAKQMPETRFDPYIIIGFWLFVALNLLSPQNLLNFSQVIFPPRNINDYVHLISPFFQPLFLVFVLVVTWQYYQLRNKKRQKGI